MRSTHLGVIEESADDEYAACLHLSEEDMCQCAEEAEDERRRPRGAQRGQSAPQDESQ